jgi:hypothetical protein
MDWSLGRRETMRRDLRERCPSAQGPVPALPLSISGPLSCISCPVLFIHQCFYSPDRKIGKIPWTGDQPIVMDNKNIE